ncbi:MAG: UbiX family flavin prenyltransferase [Polyangiales bacterium]
MKIVVGITGASGSIYARTLIESLRAGPYIELAAVLSRSAPEVWTHEVGGDVRDWLDSQKVAHFEGRNYAAPFASGSAKWDAMVVAPCSMSALARIAHGISDDLLARAADVMIKERKKLILVARETPLSEIHLTNMLTVTRAGAMVLPATPSFYKRPETIDDVVRTVIARILDHLGVDDPHAKRWGDES